MIEAFLLASQAFADGSTVPALYTCDGEDISPPLTWSGPPPGTVSFALVCEDPDAPGGTWTHWVAWNIPPSSRGLPEGCSREALLPDGTVQGVNSWGETGYGGPCPPSGIHRYIFRIYALDTLLDPDTGASAVELLEAMQGHVIGSASLTGLYSRRR